MAKLTRDRVGQTTVAQHPRENILVTGSIVANNADINCDNHAGQTATLDIRGTYVGTVELQGTFDGTNWYTIPVRPLAGGIYVTVVASASTGTWVAEVSGYDRIRARTTAFTSGLIVVVLISHMGSLPQGLQGLVTPNSGTITAASGAAATLTLAAPGVGLRHYLTYLNIERHTSAVLTAGATPTIITTTNLPTSLAFSIPADAAAQGAVYRVSETFGGRPLMSAAQNTATTIVAPTTTGVIWRITAGFYVAP